MNSENVRRELAAMCDREGLRAVARRLDVDPSYMSRVCNGLQKPGPEILKALGYKATVIYRKTNSKRSRS